MENDFYAIYKLQLHETITLENEMIVTRVPGGWIYEVQKPMANVLELIFVPYSNEYQVY